MRSKDSRYYGKRYMLRLDAWTWRKREALLIHFDRSVAEIIRQMTA